MRMMQDRLRKSRQGLSLRRRVAEGIAAWYQGRYIPPPANDPSSPIIIVAAGSYERPWLAKILGAIGRFFRKHWEFVAGTIVATIITQVVSKLF